MLDKKTLNVGDIVVVNPNVRGENGDKELKLYDSFDQGSNFIGVRGNTKLEILKLPRRNRDGLYFSTVKVVSTGEIGVIQWCLLKYNCSTVE